MPSKILAFNFGGTIAALASKMPHVGTVVSPFPGPKLVQDRIDTYLARVFAAHCGFPLKDFANGQSVEIEWCPTESHTLSENLTAPNWIQLAKDISQSINTEPESADLLGVLVLHGTDTMDIAVPLVHFLTFPPACPIIFVGSNRPLCIDDPAGRRVSDFKSDGWANLCNAVHFLLLHKHRASGTFLSFGGSILLPVNLEKYKLTTIPSMMPQVLTEEPDSLTHDLALHVERFAFHNRLLDSDIHSHEFLGRFITREVPFPYVSKLTRSSLIPTIGRSSGFQLGHESPTPFARDGFVARRSGESELRIMLCETFPSGAVPLNPDHPFTRLMIDFDPWPIFFAGPDGILHDTVYQFDEMRKIPSSIFRFRDCIPSTALAMLAALGADANLRSSIEQQGRSEWRARYIGKAFAGAINTRLSEAWPARILKGNIVDELKKD